MRLTVAAAMFCWGLRLGLGVVGVFCDVGEECVAGVSGLSTEDRLKDCM